MIRARRGGSRPAARAGLVALLLSSGCASTGSSGRVLYELSSSDVGYEWHLHARDGAFLCELPCERWIGANSGSYLAVHDPRKSWRVNIPGSLPAPPGSRVSLETRVGRGMPALGTFGYVAGLLGAAAASVGIGLLVVSYYDFVGQRFDDAGRFFIDGGSLILAAVLPGVGGVWLMDHNKAPTVRLRVMGTGIAGAF